MLVSGATFAGYVIEAIAGRGGMGVVYRAREVFPARTVALKVISPELAADAEFRARFARESNVAATIEHPNVLPIFRAGEEDGLLYIVMRYVEGTDLSAMIADGGRVERRRAVEIIAQVCAALDAAHARGLVHRDVKPANVLATREGHVYLTDFGIAKRIDATAGPTLTGYFMGTLDYAAPEQIESGQVDARTDVYATGCMLYHALVGRVPFPADSPAARIWGHLSSDPPSIRDTDASLPTQLDDVIRRAMAKKPNDRYLSAGDLGRAAKAALKGESLTRADRNVAIGEASDSESTIGVDVRRATKALGREPRNKGERIKEGAPALGIEIRVPGQTRGKARSEPIGAQSSVRRARWRAPRILLSASLVVVAAIVAGVVLANKTSQTSTQTLNTGKAETEIAKGIRQQTGVTVTMKCPSDVKIKKGKTITCKATRADGGAPLSVAVTMEDGNGNITWKVVG